MRWPNIQSIPTPALWIAQKREWHPSTDTATGAALGLTAARFHLVVLDAQPESEPATASALGLTAARFPLVVLGGQPSTDTATASALGLTAARFLPTNYTVKDGSADSNSSTTAALGLVSTTYKTAP